MRTMQSLTKFISVWMSVLSLLFSTLLPPLAFGMPVVSANAEVKMPEFKDSVSELIDSDDPDELLSVEDTIQGGQWADDWLVFPTSVNDNPEFKIRSNTAIKYLSGFDTKFRVSSVVMLEHSKIPGIHDHVTSASMAHELQDALSISKWDEERFDGPLHIYLVFIGLPVTSFFMLKFF